MAETTLFELVVARGDYSYRDFDAGLSPGRTLAGRISIEAMSGAEGDDPANYTVVYHDRNDMLGKDAAIRRGGSVEQLQDDAWALAAIAKALEAV